MASSMTTQRWARIKEVFEAVLEHAPEERLSLISSLCGEDHELKREVESLLGQQEKAHGFLETPMVDAANELWNQRSIARRRFSLAEIAGGRFKPVRLLGQGGMAMVFQATDPRIGRDVAIKTISLGDIIDPKEREWHRTRFLREVKAAGALSHPGIVTIFDAGEQGDLAYIVMELVVGPTLQRFLAGGHQLDNRSFYHLMRQTADALDYAHRKGVVHRDVKPSNIMINEERLIKITDFGIARIMSSQTTRSNFAIAGTPQYMAPEQIQGKPLDGRADQFSLAVLAYQILTGQTPFPGARVALVIQKIVSEAPIAAHVLNPSVGPRTTEVLCRAMSKDPTARFANCREFIDALEQVTKRTTGWRALPARQS